MEKHRKNTFFLIEGEGVFIVVQIQITDTFFSKSKV